MADEQVVYEGIEKYADNKYLLVNIAALRARQINEGVEVYVKTKTRHPLRIALDEVSNGFIQYALGTVEQVQETAEVQEDFLRFDDIIDLDADFDLEDEAAFDFEDVEFEEEFIESDDYSE